MPEAFQLKKYHVSTFTTNLFALVIAIFFIRSYTQKGISLWPLFTTVLIGFLVFSLSAFFMLKPAGKITSVFPQWRFTLLNVGIALLITLLFLSEIGFFGMLITLLIAFFLSTVEHILYEVMGL